MKRGKGGILKTLIFVAQANRQSQQQRREELDRDSPSQQKSLNASGILFLKGPQPRRGGGLHRSGQIGDSGEASKSGAT